MSEALEEMYLLGEEKMEKAMYLTKVEWMKVLNELLKEEKEVVKYL